MSEMFQGLAEAADRAAREIDAIEIKLAAGDILGAMQAGPLHCIATDWTEAEWACSVKEGGDPVLWLVVTNDGIRAFAVDAFHRRYSITLHSAAVMLHGV